MSGVVGIDFDVNSLEPLAVGRSSRDSECELGCALMQDWTLGD